MIVLDWSALANRSYTTAKGGTAEVGRGLGRFVNWLAGRGLSYNRVHLVGFSLGGHLVGNAGRETGSRVHRITGKTWLLAERLLIQIHTLLDQPKKSQIKKNHCSRYFIGH